MQPSRRGNARAGAAELGVLVLAIEGLLTSLLLNPWLLKQIVPGLMAVHPRRMLLFGIIHSLGMLTFGLVAWRWRAVGQKRGAQVLFEKVSLLGGMAISAGTLAVILVGQEYFFFGLNSLQERRIPTLRLHSIVEGDLYRSDSLLGFRGIPCGVRHRQVTLQPGNQPLFDITYHLDENGFRVVPQENSRKQMHLAAFGCSFMFGEGLEDQDTFPAQCACLRPDIHVYSFAMAGYSPAHPVLQLQTGSVNGIVESRGAAVYWLISDHVNRLIAGRKTAQDNTIYLPAFRLDAQGVPEYFGALADQFPFRIALDRFACSLNAAKWVGLQTIVPQRKAHIELCVALLDQARQEYRRRYPGNDFYVVLDPSCRDDTFDFPALIEALDRRHLPWLDPIDVFGAKPWDRYYFKVDGHPTPEATALLAAWFWGQFPDGLLAGPRPS